MSLRWGRWDFNSHCPLISIIVSWKAKLDAVCGGEDEEAGSAPESHRGLKISGGFCPSGFHADFQWQLCMLTTTSRDADTNPKWRARFWLEFCSHRPHSTLYMSLSSSVSKKNEKNFKLMWIQPHACSGHGVVFRYRATVPDWQQGGKPPPGDVWCTWVDILTRVHPQAVLLVDRNVQTWDVCLWQVVLLHVSYLTKLIYAHLKQTTGLWNVSVQRRLSCERGWRTVFVVRLDKHSLFSFSFWSEPYFPPEIAALAGLAANQSVVKAYPLCQKNVPVSSFHCCTYSS